ncbi:hypothetical protein RCZ04_08400 [Capnocytophaga sp. HP1101]
MKRFRMFAGPNGSGKSTLIEDVRKVCHIGYFINADIIETQLKTKGFINCEDFLPTKVTQEEWFSFLTTTIENKEIELSDLEGLRIVDDILVSTTTINSYIAAVIADFFRNRLLQTESTFSFETVMSHPSKVDFLKKAKAQGFKTYLYFVGTQDPSINIERVGLRVSKGGHSVLADKVTHRYYRSMGQLAEAFLLVDRAYIFDNTLSNSRFYYLKRKEMK